MFNLNQTVERGDGAKIPVLSAAVVRSQKAENFELFLEVPFLEVIAPPESFEFKAGKRSLVKWAGRTWELDDYPEDYNHGPWWTPGLVRFMFKSPIAQG